MAEFTRLTAEQIDHILSRYDLGPRIQAAPLQGGQANSSFKIKTPSGWFTLSVCAYKSVEEVQALTRVLPWHETCNFPTPRVVFPRSGHNVIQYQGKPVYIKTFMPGKVVQRLSPDHCFQVGKAMAALHSLTLPLDLAATLPDQMVSGFAAFEQFLSAPMDHLFSEWLEKKYAHLAACLDLSMDRTLIHGDIFWDNLLFFRGTLTAILDFEDACVDFRLLDLAIAAVGCCAVNGRFLASPVQALIVGYQTGFPLSERERAQLQLFMEYAGAATAFWRFCQYNIHHPDPDKKDYYRELSSLSDQVHAMSLTAFIQQFIP